MFPKKLVNSLSLAWLVIAIIGVLLAVREARAAGVSLFVSCIEHLEDGTARVHLGYESSDDLPGTSYLGPASTFNDLSFPPNGLSAGRHERAAVIDVIYAPVTWQFASEIGVWELIITGNEGAPGCDEWQPAAPSVPIPITSDCAFVDIRDEFGNWHRVESNGEPVLLHYGQSLIAGRNQSLDSGDYRAIPTTCY